MKLNFKELNKLSKQKGFITRSDFILSLGGGEKTFSKIKKGCKIGYELVKNIYNILGEEQTKKIIDFEKDTINGFKAKFVQVGKRLY